MQNLNEQAILMAGGRSNEELYHLALKELLESNASGRLLDFGAGSGAAIKLIHSQLSNKFKSFTGADALAKESHVPSSVNWITCDLNRPLELPDHSFDTIVSIEVIEHLENPRSVIREWNRLLSPGGTLIFSTPNNESWRALISLLCRGHFIAFNDSCYPAHITALLAKDISRMMAEVEFTHFQIKYSNYGCLPVLTSLTWQQLSFGLLNGKRFSEQMICVARKRNH